MTTIKEFWNDCHEKELKESVCGFYKSGEYFTTYEKTIDFLQIRDYVKPGLHVLEIGVGLGIATKGLYDNGLIVSGLDISDIALNKVSNYCEEIYTIDDIDKLPSDYFDIIICNRVVQHVPTDLLIEELKHSIRALKTTGIFAIQFVSNKHPGIDVSVKHMKGGRLGRTPSYLKRIIESLGGTCKLVFGVPVISKFINGNYIFHVKHKKSVS